MVVSYTDDYQQEDAVRFLTGRYADLTDCEKQIADYLITNLEKALGMSVHSLAKAVGVSVATIVRFAQHMGFEGYKAFRLHLAKCRIGSGDSVLNFPDESSSIERQVNKVVLASVEAINMTQEGIDYDVLTAVAMQIRKADQLLLFGTGTSFIVCNDAVLKYQRSGKKAFAFSDVYSGALVLANFGKDDLLVVVSHSGENADSLRILRTAKEKGIRTAAVTTFEGSSIAELADMVLITKTRESPLHNIAITSRFSQLALMDALFMAYLTLDYDRCNKHQEHLSSYLKALGII